MRKAPNALIYTVGACFCTVIIGIVVLIALGKDVEAIFQVVARTGSILSALFSGSALITSGAAYVSANRTEQQTNGVLDKRIENAVRRAMGEKE